MVSYFQSWPFRFMAWCAKGTVPRELSFETFSQCNNFEFTREEYKAYKCDQCGWIHAAIPLSAAQEQVTVVNAWYASKGEQEAESIASYMHCFRCDNPKVNFVPANPSDVLSGTSIPAAVVQGAWP